MRHDALTGRIFQTKSRVARSFVARSLVPARPFLLAALAAFSLAGPARADDRDSLRRAHEVEDSLVDLAARTSPAYVLIGGGSGVVISDDGLMVTNFHVAGSKPVGDAWRVKLPGRPIMDAVVVGHDPHGDISLLKLNGKGPFPHVELGDSDALKVGDVVMALGNPFGFSKDATPTVTEGVISVVHRNQGNYSDAIQTDTAINPGNSGGPLLDEEGRLVGINGMIAFRNGATVNTGIGYAVPVNQIKRFLEHLEHEGTVHHGYVDGLDVASTREGGEGAVVTNVASGSAADKAGFKRGDLIVEADGREVPHATRFIGILGTIPAGTEVVFKVKRGDDTIEVSAKLDMVPGDEASGEAPAPQRTNGAYFGIQMSTQDEGVRVESIEKGSPAEKAGMKVGDFITRFGRRRIVNVNQLVAQLARRRPGQDVAVRVLRDGKQIDLTVTLTQKGG